MSRGRDCVDARRVLYVRDASEGLDCGQPAIDAGVRGSLPERGKVTG